MDCNKPVAWLKEWDSVGGAQVGMRRVDLTPDCETWLANMFPKTYPLYLAHPEVEDLLQQIEYLNLKLQEAKAFIEKVADDGGNRMQYNAVVALAELEQPK